MIRFSKFLLFLHCLCFFAIQGLADDNDPDIQIDEAISFGDDDDKVAVADSSLSSNDGGGDNDDENDSNNRKVPFRMRIEKHRQNIMEILKRIQLAMQRKQKEEEHAASSPIFLSSKKWKAQCKRLAVTRDTCFAEDGASLEVRQDAWSRRRTAATTEPHRGMVLHVYEVDTCDHRAGDAQGGNDDDDDDDGGVDESSLQVYNDYKGQQDDQQCAVFSSEQYVMNNGGKLVTAYKLLEPIHLELGQNPKHFFDYAYTPALGSLPGSETKTTTTTSGEQDNDDNAQQVAVKITDSTWWKWWFVFMHSKEEESWQYYDNTKNNKRRRNQYQQGYEAMGDRAFAGGSHGEVWRGRRKCGVKKENNDCDEEKPLILKRLKVERGMELLEAGLREIYFGNILKEESAKRTRFTKYVDHFFRRIDGRDLLELWIVFEDAGSSLRSFLYSPMSTESGFVMYQHSIFWTKLRMSTMNRTRNSAEDEGEKSIEIRNESDDSDPSENGKGLNSQFGRQLMRQVMQQILESVAKAHDKGIVHRDIKPSNIMCKTKGNLIDMIEDEAVTVDDTTIKCVLGDFSSAWDSFSDENLYSNGPSAEEQTQEYAPPEALLGPSYIPFHGEKPQSYDSWSIGVLSLELLIGTPNVFSVDQRTTALLTTRMRKAGATQKDIKRALYLAALSQFCIYMPNSDADSSNEKWPTGVNEPLHKTAMVKQSCTLQDFHQALRARDPLGVGFDSTADPLLHLIWKLLAWDPLERMTPAQALRHPYFTHLDVTQQSLVPREDNALESLMLDPRMDIQTTDVVELFECPKCKRTFNDWRSCHMHANSRRHAKFCSYDRSSLPSCLNAHTLLPAHPFSGYCDIQGRRKTIEDFHAIQLEADHQYYGVFDGHTGNLAAKYAASRFHDMLETSLPVWTSEQLNHSSWKNHTYATVVRIFEEIHLDFLKASELPPLGVMDQSGTTVTTIYVTNLTVTVANIGDSRAILSTQTDGGLTFKQLTIDHIASNNEEQKLVKSRGGHIVKGSGIARVNGKLAITRSIGDAKLAPFLSRVPHVVAMTRAEVKAKCGIEGELPCFVVLASDGLWDVMSNQEVVDMVAEVVLSHDSSKNDITWEDGGAFQEAAQRLAQEAYMRGSTDNIGVCVLAIE